MAQSYYDILNVRRDASAAEIQKAYRDLARKYHPDLNPNDKNATKKFQEVQKAFDVLNDADKRKKYDQFGDAWEHAGAGGPQTQWDFSGGQGIDPQALFGQFFGGRGGFDPSMFADLGGGPATGRRTRNGGRAANRGRGADVETSIEIPFATAVTGGEVFLTLARAGGQSEELKVKIPPGLEDGQKIRLKGQGEPAAGRGAAGDLLVTVQVAAHPHFTRRGNHLYVKLPVTLAEAACGAKVEVPTPGGVVAVRVPPGASSGAKLRIKGHGVAPRGKEPGDMFAELQIVLPPHLSEAEQQQLREISERHPLAPRSELRW